RARVHPQGPGPRVAGHRLARLLPPPAGGAKHPPPPRPRPGRGGRGHLCQSAPPPPRPTPHTLLESDRGRALRPPPAAWTGAGAGGLSVRTEGLVALLAGGIAFDTSSFAPKAAPAAARTAFILNIDRATALKQPDAISARYVLYFTESLRGLSVGAPVTLLGLPAGEVTAIGLDLNPTAKTLRGRVEIVTYPERLIGRLQQSQAALGQTLLKNAADRHALVQYLVEQRGLRAQLRSGSLLT